MSIANLQTDNLKTYQNLKVNSVEARQINVDEIRSLNLNDNFFKATFTANFNSTDTVTPVSWANQTVVNTGDPQYCGEIINIGSPAAYFKFNENGVYNVTFHLNIPIGELNADNQYRFSFQDLTNINLCDFVFCGLEGHNNATFDIVHTLSSVLEPVIMNQYKPQFLFLTGAQITAKNVSGCMTITRIK